MSVSTYIPLLAFSWGLAGGFSHCIGMCGVFVAAYTGPNSPSSPPVPIPTAPNNGGEGKAGSDGEPTEAVASPITYSRGRARLYPLAPVAGGGVRHLLFHSGRLVSLMALGVVAGAVGDIGHQWASVQGAIGIAAGVVMIGLALGFVGIVPWFRIPEPDVLGAGGGVLRRMFLKALQSRHSLKPFLIGLFVGLLPCGLTYQALIPAADTGSIPRAVEIMALFGLGTVPGLLTLGVFGNALFGGLLTRPTFRSGMTRVAAGIMAIMGVAFIWRGVTGM